MRRGVLRALSIAAVAGLVAAPMTVARAENTEVSVISYAWYWESQQSQPITDPTSGADVMTIEAPNPFCPGTPAGGLPQETETCKPGRLPVEVVNSDYETPEMISAVAFDTSLVPLGSTVTKFQVTFIEANDDQSEPVNAEGKQLQACLVEQFFGDGEARQYKEAPRYTCSDTDPIAKRKEVKYKNPDGEKEDRFAWTFDLTAFANQWVSLEASTPTAAIMLFPVQPKGDDADPTTDSNWRVVMTGPSEPGAIKTTAVYDAPELPPVDTGSPVSTDTGVTSTGTDSFSPTGSAGTTPATTTGGPSAAPSPVPVAAPEQTSDVLPTAGGLPAYAWLALLAGLVAFSLFRQVVLESATGIRSDGVLAQIRRINAERRGSTIEDALGSRPGPLAPIVSGLRGLRSGAAGIVSKLPFIKRKG